METNFVLYLFTILFQIVPQRGNGPGWEDSEDSLAASPFVLA